MICVSCPLFIYICIPTFFLLSGLILVLSLTCSFCFSATLHLRYGRLWSLYPVKREAALFVHIRPYFIYFFIFRLQATFAGESSETILFFVVPRGSEEGPVKLDVRIE